MTDRQKALEAFEDAFVHTHAEDADCMSQFYQTMMFLRPHIRRALEPEVVDVEILKKEIPVGEEYEEPDPTDMYACAPFQNGETLGFARGYNKAIDYIATRYNLVEKKDGN